MANKNLNSLTFPGLSDTYQINQIAEEYSASSTYAVGDYCNYLGAIYKCNTAISTAEAWTAAHWTAVYIADEVGDLNSALEAPFVAKRGGKGLVELYTTGAAAKLETDGTKIHFAGKNLFYSTVRSMDRSAYGFGTISSARNGELTITGGTPTAAINWYFNDTSVSAANGYFLPKGTYTFSITDKSTGESPAYTNTAGWGMFYWYTDATSSRLNYQWSFNSTAQKTVTFTKDALIMPIIYFNSGNTFAATTLQFQIEAGSTATAFEESVAEIISASTADKTLVNGTTYLWTEDGTYVTAEIEETGIVNTEYPVGDVRRYGIFPDAHTNWQNTQNMSKAIANSINCGIEVFWPAGYYKSQLNLMRSNITMRFEEGAEFGGLIHLVSPYSQTSPHVGEHPLKNISLRGTLSTYSRFGMTDTQNVYIEKIHCLADNDKNIDWGSIGPGIHIYWGNDQFRCDEIVVDGCDNTGHASDAAIAIDGYSNNPKNFHIGKIHVKDSFVHGLYLTGGGHWIGEVAVDAFGSGTYSGSGLQDSNGLEQSQELCGVWLNRVYACYIGKITVNQAESGTRSNAKYSVRIDQTGLPGAGDSFGAVEIGSIAAYSVKDSNRGVTIGDINYDPPVCQGHVGNVLVKASGNGDASYGMLTLSSVTKVLVDALFTSGAGNRSALLNNSTTSKVEIVA